MTRQIVNIHERMVRTDPAVLGGLIDDLSSSRERLWPRDCWPAMSFDGPLAVGAAGGHGPVRYVVAAYQPGRAVRFAFTAPKGLHGSHGFQAEGMLLRHTLHAQISGLMRVLWPLFYRPLHDALIEDALDHAQEATGRPLVRRASWGWWVRLLRALMASRR